MFLLIILIIVCVACIIIPLINIDAYGPLIVVGIFGGALVLLTTLTIPVNNNPDKESFDKLNTEYQYLTRDIQTTPFEMRMDLYNKCVRFNKMIDDNKKYCHNTFIGFYYPEVKDSTITYFDLTKIK